MRAPMGSRVAMWSRVAPLGVAAPAAAGVAYVGAVDPGVPGHYPPCPLLWLTGLYCPGCGGLRALHALTHGDVVAAAGLNPLLLVTIPVVAVVWSVWAVRAWRGRPQRWGPRWSVVIWGYLVLMMVFGVVRNLPFAAFLAP
ncbi:DUF2752 domain-containing protein [Sphaerisporangium rubeum]|uniref:DUF2752 domain-containing protein n=1 Tax=Sphaerisporangium rubeum TaxID=321317 RepID=A0A7X0IIT5_9ACTN|nr:hypothetical protein [Sphaerisporangium rubeum]